MKNFFEFSVINLTNYIMTMGILEVIDTLHRFAIITNVITLDRACVKTNILSEMKHCAYRTELGLNLMAPSRVAEHLVGLLTNPGSPEEAYRMNSALKALDIIKNGNAVKFYTLVKEAMERRLLFQKMSQIYAPLIEEVKVNKEFLIVLVNNRLIDLAHLEELSGNDQTPIRTAHYIIHNINSLKKLSKFSFLCEKWCRDVNMVEMIFEIQFEIEMFQLSKIDDLIEKDGQKKICLIY